MSGIIPPEMGQALEHPEPPEGTDTTDLPGEPDGPPEESDALSPDDGLSPEDVD